MWKQTTAGWEDIQFKCNTCVNLQRKEQMHSFNKKRKLHIAQPMSHPMSAIKMPHMLDMFTSFAVAWTVRKEAQ